MLYIFYVTILTECSFCRHYGMKLPTFSPRMRAPWWGCPSSPLWRSQSTQAVPLCRHCSTLSRRVFYSNICTSPRILFYLWISKLATSILPNLKLLPVYVQNWFSVSFTVCVILTSPNHEETQNKLKSNSKADVCRWCTSGRFLAFGAPKMSFPLRSTLDLVAAIIPSSLVPSYGSR